MTRTLTLALALHLLLAVSPALAEPTALLPPSGVNVYEGYLAAAQSVARDHLEQNGFEVAVLPGPPTTLEIDGGEAIARAAAARARYAAVVHITHLSSSAKIKLTVYDVGGNVVRFRGTMTAATPDDLDVVMGRLVRGLATGQAPADTGEIDTVTQKEIAPYEKVHATSVWGLRIGAVTPLHTPDGAGGGLPGFGFFWLYDVRSFLADIALDFHSDDDRGDATVALGAYYPFSRSNTAPYLGGGLRYGYTDYGGDDGADGLSGFIAGGLLFGRMATVQLRGEVAVFQNLFEEKETDLDGSRDGTRNTGVMFSVGIGL